MDHYLTTYRKDYLWPNLPGAADAPIQAHGGGQGGPGGTPKILEFRSQMPLCRCNAMAETLSEAERLSLAQTYSCPAVMTSSSARGTETKESQTFILIPIANTVATQIPSHVEPWSCKKYFEKPIQIKASKSTETEIWQRAKDNDIDTGKDAVEDKIRVKLIESHCFLINDNETRHKLTEENINASNETNAPGKSENETKQSGPSSTVSDPEYSEALKWAVGVLNKRLNYIEYSLEEMDRNVSAHLSKLVRVIEGLREDIAKQANPSKLSGQELAFYQACKAASRPPDCRCPQYTGENIQLGPGEGGWSRNELLGPLLDPKLYPVRVGAAPETASSRNNQPNAFLDKLQSKYPMLYSILQNEASSELKQRIERDRNKTTYQVDYCESGPGAKFEGLQRAQDESGTGPCAQPMRLPGDPCRVGPKPRFSTPKTISKQGGGGASDPRAKCETSSATPPLGKSEYQDGVSKLGAIIMRDKLHRRQ